MKPWAYVVTILSLLVALYFFLKKENATKGYVLVPQSTIDSINSIAAYIPDTVIKTDTVFQDKIFWLTAKALPVPERIDSSQPYIAIDSLVNSDLVIYINDSTWYKNYLLSRVIGYRLFVPKTITNTITITEKIPVIFEQPSKKWFLSAGAGGNSSSFLLSAEAGYLKGNRIYSIEIERYGGNTIFKLKTGIKF